jgi:hypothetical protein
MIKEKEIWVSIPEYEWYELSNHGKVKSLSRVLETKPGAFFKTKERILNGSITSRGHIMVRLYNENGSEGFYVHFLVATMFVENTLNLKLVEHNDDDPKNNYYENLMWSTQSNNQINAKYRSDTKELNPVSQYDKSGGFIQDFESMALAYKSVGKDAKTGHIGSCCKGTLKTSYGFVWKYKTV